MTIENEKLETGHGLNRPLPAGDYQMADHNNKDISKSIERLSKDDKRKVADFIASLSAKKNPYIRNVPPLTAAEVENIEATRKRLIEASKDVEEFDVLELMDSIRR